MKKVLVIVLVLTLAITMFACGNTKEPSENGMVGVANPMVQVGSIDELNEKVGCNLVAPAIMGVTDIAYVYILGDPSVAEYDFYVNGYVYSFRAAKDLDEDISGVYIDGQAFTGKATNDISYVQTDTLKLARFAIDKYQYSLVVEDNGDYDLDQFKSIVEELKSLASNN